jgi:hypothetical protein
MLATFLIYLPIVGTASVLFTWKYRGLVAAAPSGVIATIFYYGLKVDYIDWIILLMLLSTFFWTFVASVTVAFTYSLDLMDEVMAHIGTSLEQIAGRLSGVGADELARVRTAVEVWWRKV